MFQSSAGPAPARPHRAPDRPFADLWRHRELVRAILSRELSVRFRGSVVGWAWAILAPLAMLAVYTAVFSSALRLDAATRPTDGLGRFGYAFSIFAGLIVFNAFSEIAYRAPVLLAEHRSIIRRSIFPPQILAFIAVARALVYALIALGVMLAGLVLVEGTAHLSWLLLPLVLLPLALGLVGAVWILSTIGALTSDLNHLIIAIIPVAMFATPVFYTAADVPEAWRPVLYANPLSWIIGLLREVALDGTLPSWPLALGAYAGGITLFYGGRVLFMRKKAILVDLL